MSTPKPLPPTETLALPNSLTLAPRIKLLLTLHRADDSVSPLDTWLLKTSLISFLESSFSISLPLPDLHIVPFKDLKKRKRHDPVARGTIIIRDLDFASLKLSKFEEEEGEEEKGRVLERKFAEWRKNAVEKMDGMEMRIVGDRFKLSVEVPVGDDFERMKKEWEELAAFGNRGYARGGRRLPDTIILKGVPTRWFVEPLVPDRPSQIVTHTIFSALGEIRTLDVKEDNDTCNLEDEEDGYTVPGLHCKIIVRYKEYSDFCNALKVLSGRSLQKQGSRLKADYEVTWDKDGFGNARSQPEETDRWMPSNRYSREDGQSYNSRFSSEKGRPKRFKE
ncbi:hypothetical protein DCAR_0626414 [Daucus carota subsp. sativus]|uniref:RRM domain-containing protein n=1 Tax=Daucus carota subsp. sativus TaxID=79200 RepID=A0AAF0XFS8_DAUCS|nr:PREDICTED: A-kinase anchor protein 17A [Daucus carota subsp. sativus]WOH06985.1 hypothetical protein DCAR_0626414 [Daucus carota subsp. sativus]